MESERSISWRKCFEMNFDGRCEQYDSCEECMEEEVENEESIEKAFL